MRFFFFTSLFLLFVQCANEQTPSTSISKYVKVEGKTMGTTYHITYSDAQNRNFKPVIDSILVAINLEVSTYIDTSTISKFNQATAGVFDLKTTSEAQKGQPATHFIANFEAAKNIYEKTAGYFDPTVMPLVNYWGFGYTPKKPVTQVDSVLIDSIMGYVGFDKLEYSGSQNLSIDKKEAGTQLDFSAIAKGYAVDDLGRFLEKKGIKNYLVEIGGEVRARGKNAAGKFWTIGINVPKEDAAATDFQATAQLENLALATSGNYRNFYEVEGKKYSHTIQPKTGFPERNTLLSASVFAKDCMIADAYATAFMTMGLEKSVTLAEQTPELDAYFIYSDEDGRMKVQYTSNLEKIISDQ